MVKGATVVAGIVAFSLAKKLAVYLIARTYGFVPLYRRIITLERKLVKDRIVRSNFETGVKFLFRLPNHVYYYFKGKGAAAATAAANATTVPAAKAKEMVAEISARAAASTQQVSASRQRV